MVTFKMHREHLVRGQSQAGLPGRPGAFCQLRGCVYKDQAGTAYVLYFIS